jgi:hypothetical protein
LGVLLDRMLITRKNPMIVGYILIAILEVRRLIRRT